MKVSTVSENAILINLAEQISEDMLPKLRRLEHLIETAMGPALIDLVPSYTTLLCLYDLNQLDYLAALKCINRAVEQLDMADAAELIGRDVDIPVYYDTSVGYDLAQLAADKNLTLDDVIDLHCSSTYRVFAIGFLPGFGFMGSVDSRLETPRKTTPRPSVGAGSVGIADKQTAVYPQQSPGGWNIIGRSPIQLFRENSANEHPAVLQVGDQVRFYPISLREFRRMGGELD